MNKELDQVHSVIKTWMFNDLSFAEFSHFTVSVFYYVQEQKKFISKFPFSKQEQMTRYILLSDRFSVQ